MWLLINVLSRNYFTGFSSYLKFWMKLKTSFQLLREDWTHSNSQANFNQFFLPAHIPGYLSNTVIGISIFPIYFNRSDKRMILKKTIIFQSLQHLHCRRRSQPQKDLIFILYIYINIYCNYKSAAPSLNFVNQWGNFIDVLEGSSKLLKFIKFP